jgi:hypothetical protein
MEEEEGVWIEAVRKRKPAIFMCKGSRGGILTSTHFLPLFPQCSLYCKFSGCGSFFCRRVNEKDVTKGQRRVRSHRAL